MRPAAYASLAVVAIAMLFDRLAYYGARSVLFFWMESAHGLTFTDAASRYSLLTIVTCVAVVGAGAVAIVAGPRVVAIIGALFATLGAVLAATNASPTAVLVTFAIGAGALRPCLSAIAADTIVSEDRGPDGALAPSPRRFAALAAVFFFLYAEGNFTGALGPAVGAWLYSLRGAPTTFGATAALYVVVLLATVVLTVLGARTGRASAHAPPPNVPYRAPGPPAPAAPPPSGRAAVGLVLLVAPFFVSSMAESLATSAVFTARGASPTTAGYVQAISPILGILVSMGLFVVWLVFAIHRRPTPPLPLAGIGFAVFGLGLFPMTFLSSGSALALAVLGTMITGAGEAMAGPVISTYAATVPRRGIALAFGIITAISYVGGLLGSLASSVATPVLIFLGLLCLGAGIGLTAAGKKMHVAFFGQ